MNFTSTHSLISVPSNKPAWGDPVVGLTEGLQIIQRAGA